LLLLGVFVGAQVDGADGEGFAVEFGDAFFVGVEMVFFGGGLVACEVEELGAEESDALATFVEEVGDFVGKLDVSEEFDFDAIGGDCLEGGEFMEGDACLFGGFDEFLVLGDGVIVGVEDDGAGVAIDDDELSVACVCGNVFGAYDGGEGECTGDDGGVGGAAAEVGGEAGDIFAVEVGGLGGGEVAGDDDGVVGDLREGRGGLS